MKTNALSLLALTGALFLMAACASEETNSQQELAQKPDTKGLTAFIVNNGATRTTADYDGSGLNFYWTEGDRLWVNNGTLIQDNHNNVAEQLTPNPATPAGVKRAATARFYFSGTYTAPSYPVRYTGTNSTTGDKIIIPANQYQRVWNDASHIGTSGDCGTAIAIKSGDGYSFVLDHKAAYITFTPYNASLRFPGRPLTQIKITADKAICGQFDFDDNGIDLTSRPVASVANQSITLKLGSPNPKFGFFILTSPDPRTTSTIVLAPGTYSTFTVDYVFYTYSAYEGGGLNKVDHFTTYSKTYHNVTFAPGKNKLVETDFNITTHYRYPANYHSGEETNSIANSCPNMNEIIWYVLKGDPHWDDSKYFTVNNKPYNGGMWIKKQSVIAADNGKSVWQLKDAAPDGVNYNHEWLSHSHISGGWPKFSNTSVTMGEPSNPDDYFFVPALGEGSTQQYSSLKGMGQFAELYCSETYSFNVWPYSPNRYYMACSRAGISSNNAHTHWMMQAWPAVR